MLSPEEICSAVSKAAKLALAQPKKAGDRWLVHRTRVLQNRMCGCADILALLLPKTISEFSGDTFHARVHRVRTPHAAAANLRYTTLQSSDTWRQTVSVQKKRSKQN
jgi:hypothetical protein